MNKANVLTLEPAGEVVGSIYDDVRSLLMQAIRYVIENDEFLVVEKGGWDAPNEPFCLFIVVAEADGLVSVSRRRLNRSIPRCGLRTLCPVRRATP